MFATLGSLTSWTALPPPEKDPDDAGKLALARYLDFRGNVGAIAYTNPAGRRFGNWLFLSAYDEAYDQLPTRMGRRAMGALLVHDVLTRPEIYASVPLPKALEEKNAEAVLAIAFADWLKENRWTFREDHAFRAAAKQFANVNGLKTFTTGRVTFPNKLTLSLDPAADEPLRTKRDAWVKQQYDERSR